MSNTLFGGGGSFAPGCIELRTALVAILLSAACAPFVKAQQAFVADGISFEGVLHDNISNRQRQGSGFTPLRLKAFPDANLFRDDAVGLNFEHIFNGAKADHGISMFTPRKDPCTVKQVGAMRYEVHWPAEGSKWGLEAQMVYDLTTADQVDLTFQCTPTLDRYPQGYVAMMWASYMNRTYDRTIRFWGQEKDRTGWVSFGEGTGRNFEVGTVAHVGVRDLPFEEGSQTLNLIENPAKKFLTPFYYGLIDGDHDLTTEDDKLLYLMLFDQTESIRFAMWNFIRDASGEPDAHSPAWDWQYVIRKPEVGKQYGYRARVVVKPFTGVKQVWEEYRKWKRELGVELPDGADS